MTLGYIKVTSESPLINGEVEVLSPDKIKLYTAGLQVFEGPVGPAGPDGPTGPAGPAGPAGPQGIQGPATVSVGTTTTGQPGTNASVTNTGTSENAVLTFTIPRGAVGATGPQGPKGDTGETGATGSGITWKGTWKTTTTYSYGDAVNFNGSSYFNYSSEPNLNIQPDSNPAYWEYLALKGDTGETGADGAMGPTGPAGPGVPTGGTTGQVLSKINSTDYNTQWVTPAAGGTDLTAGPIRSSGSTSSIFQQTGTGSKIVVDTNPTLIGPTLGDANANTINGATIRAFNQNVAVGLGSILPASTTGINNTGFGLGVLAYNTTGGQNNAVGAAALGANTTGSGNNAMGSLTLSNNTTGASNTGVGSEALRFNTTGNNNVAIGTQALIYNTTATGNVSIGVTSSLNNTTGAQNISIGGSSLLLNVVGSGSTSVGLGANRGTTSIINTLSITNPGSGYTDGSYSNVTLVPQWSDIAGQTNPTANIVVSDGQVISVTLVTFGNAMRVNGTLSATIGSSGSGFIATITAVTTGQNNTAIGWNAGRVNETGSRNVFLGYNAGRNETTSDNLYISNSDTSTPLIKGKFDSTGSTGGNVKINGDFIIKSKTPTTETFTGTAGEISWDSTHFYVCVGTNLWKRVEYKAGNW